MLFSVHIPKEIKVLIKILGKYYSKWNKRYKFDNLECHITRSNEEKVSLKQYGAKLRVKVIRRSPR